MCTKIYLLQTAEPKTVLFQQCNEFKDEPDSTNGCTHQEPKNNKILQIIEVGQVRCEVVAVAKHNRAINPRVGFCCSFVYISETAQTCFLAMTKLSQGDQVWGHNRTNCTHKQITCPSTSGRLVQLLILTNSHLQVIPSISIYIYKTYRIPSAIINIPIPLTN